MSDLAIVAPRHRRRPRARIAGASAGNGADRLNRCAWPQRREPARDLGTCPTDEDRSELRRRLFKIIGKASGCDRQCHLTVAAMATRVRAAERATQTALRAMKREGVIDRFDLANGRTATMILRATRD